MQINKELIQKIALNARLKLTDKEINEFLPQLKEILNAFSEINKIDTTNVQPSFQPIEIKNVFRPDKVEKCFTSIEALSNTKHKKDSFFIGPKAI